MEEAAISRASFRIWLWGPLRVERQAGEHYEAVKTADWGGSNYPRLLLKALLCCPGRRGRREALLDMLWSETESEQATANLNTATTKLRTLLRPAKGQESLLITEDDATIYQLPDQGVLWVDSDAVQHSLERAERLGRASAEMLPLLEEAISLSGRGTFLEGEEGKWAAEKRATRDLERYRGRIWLAESYGQHGRAGQAETLLTTLLEDDPFDEDVLCRLMALLQSQGMTHQALLLYQRMQDFFTQEHMELTEATKQLAACMEKERQVPWLACSLGMDAGKDVTEHTQGKRGFVEVKGAFLSNGLEQIVTSLDKHLPTLALISPFQPFGGILGKMHILEKQEMQRASRRHVLQQLLGIVSFAQIPLLLSSSLTAPNDSIEEFLSCCEENILACWQLMKGKEIAVVPSVLCTWLPPLEPFAREPAPYQKQSASLAVQGYIIAGLVRVLQRDYDGAEWCCKQALEYCEIAQDPNLKVAALKHLATKYNDAGYHFKTLHTYQEALSFKEQVSPLLQSRIHLGLALSYAHCQEKQQAWRYYELAQEGFPERPEHDPSFAYADCGKSSLNHYGGLMYLEFGQPEKAWEVFHEVVQLQQQTNIPERTAIEIVNCKAEAALAQKNLDRVCIHLQEGVQGARRLKSEMRFHDSAALYQRAQAIWPHEPALRELEGLFY